MATFAGPLSNTIVRPTAAVSFEAWVNPTSTGLAQAFAYIGGCGDTGFNGYALWLASGVPTWHVGKGDGATAVSVTGSAFTANTWYHVVGTWDGTTARLYVNGALANSSAINGLGYGSATSFYIGTLNDATLSGRYFDGRLFGVAVYATVLTATQIANHWACRLDVFPSITGTFRVIDVSIAPWGAFGDQIVNVWRTVTATSYQRQVVDLLKIIPR